LIGDADYTVKALSRKLGWTIPPAVKTVPKTDVQEVEEEEEERVWLSGVGDLYVPPIFEGEGS